MHSQSSPVPQLYLFRHWPGAHLGYAISIPDYQVVRQEHTDIRHSIVMLVCEITSTFTTSGTTEVCALASSWRLRPPALGTETVSLACGSARVTAVQSWKFSLRQWSILLKFSV